VEARLHAPRQQGTKAPAACAGCEHFKWAAIAAIVFGWPPILRKAWVAVRHLSIDINVLMTIAVVGALVIEEYVEGGAVVFLFSLSNCEPQ
jgi:cation transport ATPase